MSAESGLESSFRFQLSTDFKSFKTFEIYKKLSLLQTEKLLDSLDLVDENKLWKLSHYKIINEFRLKLKGIKGNDKLKLQSQFSYFLTLSTGTYLSILKSLPLPPSLATTFQIPLKNRSSITDILVCKVCVRLGDLARYKGDISLAKLYYHEALRIDFKLGQVYNQLGVIEEGLEAVVWYLRGLRWGFEGSRANLERTGVEWVKGVEWEHTNLIGNGQDRIMGRVCVGVMEIFKELKSPRKELLKICESILERFLLKVDDLDKYEEELPNLKFVVLVVLSNLVDNILDKTLAKCGTWLWRLTAERFPNKYTKVIGSIGDEIEYTGLVPLDEIKLGTGEVVAPEQFTKTCCDQILFGIRRLCRDEKRMYEDKDVMAFSTESLQSLRPSATITPRIIRKSRNTTEQGEFIEESDTLNTLSFLGLSPKPLLPETVKRTSVRLVTFPSPIGTRSRPILGTAAGFSDNNFKRSQVVDKNDNLFCKLSEYQQSMLSGGSFGFGWNGGE